jgi:uncharacterized protein YwgA
MAQEARFAVIRHMVAKLGDIGKIQMQKLVYFLQEIFQVPFGYDYKMHHYGPYSDELNDDLIIMQLNNHVEVGADPSGYGYHIILGSESVAKMDEVIGKYSSQMNKCLDALGESEPSRLEVLSTLHFVKYIAGVSDESTVIEKTAMLKPIFSRQFIEESYRKLESIISSAS